MEDYFARAVEQMDDGVFAACGGYFYYAIKARKPR